MNQYVNFNHEYRMKEKEEKLCVHINDSNAINEGLIGASKHHTRSALYTELCHRLFVYSLHSLVKTSLSPDEK